MAQILFSNVHFSYMKLRPNLHYANLWRPYALITTLCLKPLLHFKISSANMAQYQ